MQGKRAKYPPAMFMDKTERSLSPGTWTRMEGDDVGPIFLSYHLAKRLWDVFSGAGLLEVGRDGFLDPGQTVKLPARFGLVEQGLLKLCRFLGRQNVIKILL